MARKVCVFVDGENFRHAIVHLFESFNPADYLPKKADWDDLFDYLVRSSCTGYGDVQRIRTYWYVIQYIDYFPFYFPDAVTETEELKALLSKHEPFRNQLAGLSGNNLTVKLKKLTEMLLKKKTTMQQRFEGWTIIQNAIAKSQKSIEFRRAGGIRYDLFTGEFGTEKAVDVKLAVDLLDLRNIFDIAIIVSGDQDYVPAVEAIKNYGKEVVNAVFRTRGGKLLPGGARRLNQVTDWSYEVPYTDLKAFLKL